MKKLTLIALFFAVMTMTISAQVIAVEDSSNAQKNYTGRVDLKGTSDARISYNGIEIFAPEGQKTSVYKNSDIGLFVEGTSFNYIVVNGKKVTSNGATILAVNKKTKEITPVLGDNVVVKDLTAEEAKEIASKFPQNTAVVAAPVANTAKTEAKDNANKKDENKKKENVEDNFPSSSVYINEVVSQQFAQDILSPSAPRR